MNDERLETVWYAVRPCVVYSILFMTVQAIALRLLESLLIALHADMAAYYLQYRPIAEELILAAAVFAGILPVLREGQREILRVQNTGGGFLRSFRTEDPSSPMIFAAGSLCLSLALNITLLSLPALGGPQAMSEGITAASLPLAAVVYGLLTPLAEEMIYRGLMFARLRTAFGFWQSAAVSALVFGISHGNLRQGIYGFVMGIVLAAGYEMSGRFAYPVILHSMCNLCILLMNSSGTLELVRSPAWAALFWMLTVAFMVFWRQKMHIEH